MQRQNQIWAQQIDQNYEVAWAMNLQFLTKIFAQICITLKSILVNDLG